MNDARGTPVSCSNPAQLEGYEASLRSYQNYVGDPIAKIDSVLTEHEDFVLGHVFRSAVLMTAGERRVVADADRSLRRAETLAGSANDREKGLIRATRLLVNGDWHAACAAYDAVLAEHPRDIFALQTAHLFDFYRGDALNLRNRVARVLSRCLLLRCQVSPGARSNPRHCCARSFAACLSRPRTTSTGLTSRTCTRQK